MSLVQSGDILICAAYRITLNRTILKKSICSFYQPGEVLRCSAFILSSFHTPANALFHCLPMCQTKGRVGRVGEVGGLREKAKCSFLCAPPFHFFAALPQMDPSQSEKPPSQLFTEETSCVCVSCVCDLCVRLRTCKLISKRQTDDVLRFTN